MVTQMAQQDVISNNLANLNTVGFKRDLALFRARTPMHMLKMQPAVPGLGAPAMINSLGTIYIDAMVDQISAAHSQGDLKDTDNPSDLALRGDGFFVIRDRQGNEVLSRNGEFHVDPQRRLVDGEGNPVLGRAGEILLPDRGRLTISDDGTVIAGTQEIDKLRIVTVPDPMNQLKKQGANYYVPGPGIPVFTSRNFTVHQGFLEMSSASPITEMVNMISALRTYEASQRTMTTLDETLGRAVNDIARPA